MISLKLLLMSLISGGFRGGGGKAAPPLSKQGEVQGRIAPPEQIWVDFLETIFSHKLQKFNKFLH